MSVVSSAFRARSGMGLEESAISLSLMGCRIQPKARLQSLRSGTQSDPTISSITTAIMMTTSNSPAKGSGCPIITSVIYCTPGYFRAVPHANRTFSTANSPIPCATSSADEPRVSGPWLPWRGRSRRMLGGETDGVSRVRADRERSRFHQLPCLLMCPSRRRSPLDSSDGTSPT
jgi:hypothetical protein